MSVRPGDPVKHTTMNRALAGADAVLGRGRGLGSPAGRGGPTQLMCEITALANDDLTVRRLDASGAMIGAAFDAAKPFELRHVAANYDWPTGLTTTNTNEVEVTDGTDTYTWIVTPIYRVGDPIKVEAVPFSGVTVSGSDLKWEASASTRTWAVEL